VKKKILWSLWGVFGVLVLLIYLGQKDPTPEEKVKQETERFNSHLAMQACSASQDAVRQRLKAPSTAEFPGCILSIGEYRITTNSDQTMIFVAGYVGAQNSFGAKLRTNFKVQLLRHPKADDAYQPIEFTTMNVEL
jgi:hypothetical protein